MIDSNNLKPLFHENWVDFNPTTLDEPQPECPTCMDAGSLAIRFDDGRNTEYAPCGACALTHAETIVARIPPAFARELNDPTYHDGQRLGTAGKAVHDWAHATVGSLMLVGTPGTGKSTLATAAYRWMIRNVNGIRSAEWVKVPTLLQSIRDSYDRKFSVPVDSDLLSRCRTCDLLLLDDLGAQSVNERNAPWVREQLYSVIDYRSDWNLRTIFTSNLPLPALKVQLGDALTSRIVGVCGSNILAMNGKDLRYGDA